MLSIKQKLLRGFFLLEVILFTMFCFFGPSGVSVISEVEKENELLSKEVLRLEQEVVELENKVDSWRNDPFKVEKLSRENLQMSKNGEEVYFVDVKKKEKI